MTKQEVMLKVVLPVCAVLCVIAIALGVFFGVYYKRNQEMVNPPKGDDGAITDSDKETEKMFDLVEHIDGALNGFKIRTYKGFDLQEVAIPETYKGKPILSIGEGAFQNHKEIRVVKLPDNLRTIRGNAFAGCAGIFEITIPKNVKDIGMYAFGDCVNLVALTLEKAGGLKNAPLESDLKFSSEYYIEPLAFANCVNLTKLIVNSGVIGLSVKNGTVNESLGSFPITVSSLSEVILKDDVTAVGDCAFTGTNITKVTIGNGLKYLGIMSFMQTKITEIILPDSLTEFGTVFGSSMAFSDCKFLTYVKLPAGIKTIPGNILSDCPQLKTVILPNVVESVEMSAFRNSPNLEIAVPSTVKTIGERAFYGTKVKEVNLFNATSIAEEAFSNCEELVSVSFADSYLSIGTKAFYNCTNLITANLSNVTEMGRGVFEKCSSLQSIKIPASLKRIGGANFYGCEALKEMYIENINVEGLKFNSNFNIDNNKKLNLEKLTIVAGDIGDINSRYSEFEGINTLKEVILGNYVNSIGNYAFKNTAITSLLIPSSVQIIGVEAFSWTPLKIIEIPNSVFQIGEYAFNNCNSLSSVKLSSNLTELANGLFSGCANLTDINLPSKLTKIGESAFNTTGLTSIILPSTLQEIGGQAFYNSKITSVIIPENVQVMEHEVFANCENLTDVTFLGSVPPTLSDSGWLDENLFLECKSLTKIYVPKGLYDDYSIVLDLYKSMIIEISD